MLERPQAGERAILVHIHFPFGDMQEDLLEFQELALSAGAHAITMITGTRLTPDAKYFVGSGKANEIQVAINTYEAQLVIFNHALSPAQERNLEHLFKCRVIDRTGLILDIFAQRARSYEGKLQVELALLNHISTRLVRFWTHLERQRGGIGLRGPGETQLETDRRLIKKRMVSIKQRLTKVREQRAQSRRSRQTLPAVALIGYTNAGKSTLFNALTGAAVYVADQLFATLDPTLRKINLPEFGDVILADTVGFIRHLPHHLIDAFHATLEEVCEADLLLHVVDISDDRMHENIAQVNAVLTAIGGGEIKQILVYNKIDLCPDNVARMDDSAIPNVAQRLRVSARQLIGLKDLRQLLTQHLSVDIIQSEVELTPHDAKLRAALYRLNAVISESLTAAGHWQIVFRLPRLAIEKLFR